jgi:signal transduction histidine kinase/DNA-binding response OmpR family regulator
VHEPRRPANETARLRALRELEVLDTPAETAFDDIVELAAAVAGTPIALISLADANRQWFKARVGLDATETPRDLSFCGHVVANDQPLIVGNALDDERFADNPLVSGPPDIRFYAGHPLIERGGHCLGTLCVIDREPRELSGLQRAELDRLSRIAVRLLERRLADRRAARAEEISRRVFELSAEPMCVLDDTGAVLAANPAFEDQVGVLVRGTPLRTLVVEADRADVSDALDQLALTAEPVRFEARPVVLPQLWLSWMIVRDPATRAVVGIARDESVARRLADELRAAVTASDNANRAKSTFLANMSHELRTPLNSVIGFANLLSKNRRGSFDPKELDYLSRILDNGKHLLRLINDVLDLSKVEAGRLELHAVELDAAALIRDVVTAMESRAAERGLRIAVDAAPAARPITADSDRLRQVLINLIENGLKFGTKLGVEVRVRTQRTTGRVVRIEVVDDGIGIPHEVRERIFEPFRQADESTSRQYGGTGLGLSISRALCKQMGFELACTSEIGAGSTFAIVLDPSQPLRRHVPPGLRASEPLARVAVVGAKLASDPELRGARVLVIDDSADARAMMRTILEDAGCSVSEAIDGISGLELARLLRPDVMTLDLMMPRANGWTVLRHLRADPELRTIPVIVCSSAGGEARASLVGPVDVIDKPVDPDALRALVARRIASLDQLLVVDDDLHVRVLLTKLGEELGARVRTASDGQKALQAIAERRPSLVILDLAMPVMDGFEFLEKLRACAEYADLPVLICTASIEDQTRAAFLREHSQGRLSKSHLDADTMRTAIRGALARVRLEAAP